jgi:hypothetical protein
MEVQAAAERSKHAQILESEGNLDTLAFIDLIETALLQFKNLLFLCDDKLHIESCLLSDVDKFSGSAHICCARCKLQIIKSWYGGTCMMLPSVLIKPI